MVVFSIVITMMNDLIFHKLTGKHFFDNQPVFINPLSSTESYSYISLRRSFPFPCRMPFVSVIYASMFRIALMRAKMKLGSLDLPSSSVNLCSTIVAFFKDSAFNLKSTVMTPNKTLSFLYYIFAPAFTIHGFNVASNILYVKELSYA